MISVIVVDDEVSTLQGIAHILRRYPAEFEVALEANSALQALSLLEHREVDVVITDIRMPVMDGVQLVGLLAQRYPNIRTIVLSAYGDYDYVRACMKHGAVDYLIKPCRYQTLLSILRRIGEDKLSQGREEALEETKKRFKALLASYVWDSTPNLPFSVLRLVHMRSGTAVPRLLEKLQSCLQYRLPSEEEDGFRYFTLDMEDHALLLMDESLLHPNTEGFLMSLYRKLAGDGELTAMAWVVVPAVGDWLNTVKGLKKLCEFVEFNGIGRLVAFGEMKSLYEQTMPSNFSIYWATGRLLKLLRLRDASALSAGLSEMMKNFTWPKGYINPDEIKRETMQLLLSLSQDPLRPPLDMTMMSHSYTEYVERVNRARKPQDLLRAVEDYVLAVGAAGDKGNRPPRYILDAVQYMKIHYMENILLPDVSRAVFLNEWYFSSQFKRHMGVSFKEYLNNIRIDAAKKLLLDNDLKVGQIAEMVGFGDATYFATAFKMIAGKTPKEYRKAFVADA